MGVHLHQYTVCPRCGTEIIREAQYCARCGYANNPPRDTARSSAIIYIWTIAILILVCVIGSTGHHARLDKVGQQIGQTVSSIFY